MAGVASMLTPRAPGSMSPTRPAPRATKLSASAVRVNGRRPFHSPSPTSASTSSAIVVKRSTRFSGSTSDPGAPARSSASTPAR